MSNYKWLFRYKGSLCAAWFGKQGGFLSDNDVHSRLLTSSRTHSLTFPLTSFQQRKSFFSQYVKSIWKNLGGTDGGTPMTHWRTISMIALRIWSLELTGKCRFCVLQARTEILDGDGGYVFNPWIRLSWEFLNGLSQARKVPQLKGNISLKVVSRTWKDVENQTHCHAKVCTFVLNKTSNIYRLTWITSPQTFTHTQENASVDELLDANCSGAKKPNLLPIKRQTNFVTWTLSKSQDFKRATCTRQTKGITDHKPWLRVTSFSMTVFSEGTNWQVFCFSLVVILPAIFLV